jgi:hypothetical protein
MCGTGPWHWGTGAMVQQVCVVLSAAERDQLAAIAADRNRPRKHIERATDRPRLSRSASAAAGGAKHRRQPADGVAMATALCRERDRRAAARQDPQARQGADRGGNRGARGGDGVHRAAAPSHSTCRRRSMLLLTNTTPTPNPSSGLNPPRPF